jgi:hypothetical protein
MMNICIYEGVAYDKTWIWHYGKQDETNSCILHALQTMLEQ